MEKIAGSANLNQAYKRVKANQGAPGVDGMTVTDLRPWIAANREALIASLLDGSYQPQPVRGVEIPKPGGGKRQLGIPTVVDRLVQQAILQVLEPLLDPSFSASSFGFRPGRGAHDALHQAREYVADGREIVVDLDLEKFFDRVNHDVMMSRLARRIGDKRLLRIIRRFLAAGMMQYGVSTERHEGTPQGGPLSPLLANLLLDDLDKELERRGHRFCRYADDCNIYVRSQAAGERVMASVTWFLERRLRLKVNRQKSAVAPVGERKFLGYRLDAEGDLGIAPKSLQRAKDRLRQITRRNRGVSLGRMIDEANGFYRMGDVLPPCTGAQRAARPRWLAAPQAALRAAQALQAARGTATVPLSTRGLAATSPRAGLLRPRLVVSGQFAAGEDRHEHHLVRPTWTDQPDSPPCRAKRPGKPPWYVVRTPGGVRGGDREEPPYSIALQVAGFFRRGCHQLNCRVAEAWDPGCAPRG